MKDKLKHFWLYHSEKLILGLSVLGLAALFYFGWSTPKYGANSGDKTPKQLKSLAQQANDHILKNTSWDSIAEFRKGEKEVDLEIERLAGTLDVSKYDIPPIAGTARATLGLRPDPKLLPIEDMIVQTFPATMMMEFNRPSKNSLLDLPLAIDFSEEDEEADEEDERSGDRGGFDPGGGGMGGGSGSGAEDEDLLDREVGVTLPEYQKLLIPGLRPSAVKLNVTGDDKVRPYAATVVSIMAVVPYRDQWANYTTALKSSQSYFPDRDKPYYRFVQVMRREVKSDGTKGEWVDRSDWIHNRLPASYTVPYMPEVVSPENYDENLTMPIPPIAGSDYRKYAIHPKCMSREFDLGDKEDEEEEEEPDDEDLFKEASDDPNERGGVGGRGGRNGRSGRNRQYEEEEEREEDEGDSYGGRGRGGRGGYSGGQSQYQTGTTLGRIGSDRKAYEEIADIEEEDAAKYKMIRVFDLITNSRNNVSKQYEYKMRIYIGDPNNDDDSLRKVVDERSGAGNIGASGGMAGGGTGDKGGSSGGGDEEGAEKKVYKYIPLSTSMLNVDVRNRLAKEAEALESDPLPTTIAEKFEDGTFGINPLSFCRRTPWTPEEGNGQIIKASETPSEFYAGKVMPERLSRYPGGPVPVTEPTAEMVAAEFDKTYGVAKPGKLTVRRADWLNFQTNAHILNPMDWSVRVLAKEEVKTSAFVVDILGGGKVDGMPRSKLSMDYYHPGEILIFDKGANKFRVQNDIDDREGYLRSLFLGDEFAEVGKRKKKKSSRSKRGGEEEEEDDEDDFFGR